MLKLTVIVIFCAETITVTNCNRFNDGVDSEHCSDNKQRTKRQIEQQQ